MIALAFFVLAAPSGLAQQADSLEARKVRELGDFAFRSEFAGAGTVLRRLDLKKDPDGAWVQILEFRPDWSANPGVPVPPVLRLRQTYATMRSHTDSVPLEPGKRYLLFGFKIGADGPEWMRREFEGILSVGTSAGGIFEIEGGRLRVLGDSIGVRLLDGLEEHAARRILVDAHAAARLRENDRKENLALWQASELDYFLDSITSAGAFAPILGVPFRAETESTAIFRDRWFRGLHPMSWFYILPTGWEETLKLFAGYGKRPFDGSRLKEGKDAWFEKSAEGVHQSVALRWHPSSKGTKVTITEQPVLVGDLPNWPLKAMRVPPDVSGLDSPLKLLSGKEPVFVREAIGDAAIGRRVFTLGYLLDGARDDVLKKVKDELGPDWTDYLRSDSAFNLSPKKSIKDGWYAYRLAPLGLEGGADAPRSLLYATWVEPR